MACLVFRLLARGGASAFHLLALPHRRFPRPLMALIDPEATDQQRAKAESEDYPCVCVCGTSLPSSSANDFLANQSAVDWPKSFC